MERLVLRATQAPQALMERPVQLAPQASKATPATQALPALLARTARQGPRASQALLVPTEPQVLPVLLAPMVSAPMKWRWQVGSPEPKPNGWPPSLDRKASRETRATRAQLACRVRPAQLVLKGPRASKATPATQALLALPALPAPRALRATPALLAPLAPMAKTEPAS